MQMCDLVSSWPSCLDEGQHMRLSYLSHYQAAKIPERSIKGKEETTNTFLFRPYSF